MIVEQDNHLKNKVILWSDPSDVTEIVHIPERLYFFPLDIREAAETVIVQVYKYIFGYWYGQKFSVRPGEVIGKITETELETGLEEEQPEGLINIQLPKKVDYSTGAVFLDYVPLRDWSGGKYLRERAYFDMLYTFDGMNIEHVPTKRSYWPKELSEKYNDIQKLEQEPKQPLRPWGGKVTRRDRGAMGRRFDEEEE